MVFFVDPVELRKVDESVHPVKGELPYYDEKSYLPEHGLDVGDALQIHLKPEIYRGIYDRD